MMNSLPQEKPINPAGTLAAPAINDQGAVAEQRTFVAQAVDPVHIGTGEFRLGRVDNTIVREPGTNLPKIPGSSIAGVTRAYSAMKAGTYFVNGNSCAGKGGKDGDGHCGKCDICIAFGFARTSGGFQGMAQFSDARLLFFPVYSLIGPVWISCPSALKDASCSPLGECGWDEWNSQLSDGAALTAREVSVPQINLGWLYLPLYAGVTSATFLEWAADQTQLWTHLSPVLKNLVIVSDSSFSAIVDDQLEVRTSVSISPQTGAAEPGALFTTEALPRATVLQFQVTALNSKNFRLPNGTTNGKPVERGISAIHDTVWSGLELIEFLGIGGINTRGMGRMRVFPHIRSLNV